MGVHVKQDALGKIFRVEKRLGRGDEFEIISHFLNGDRKVSRYRHETCDGLGALLLESSRWSSVPIAIPTFRMKKRCDLLSFMRGVVGFFEDFSPSKTLWKHLEVNAPYTSQHLAWRVFSERSTEDLLKYAKAKNVSLNSVLLAAVSSAVGSLLLKDSQTECRWLIPVNMRMSPSEALNSANHTSSVGVRFCRDVSLTELDATLKKSLNPWRVLFAYRLAAALSRLSEDVLFKLAKKRGEHNFWIGSFSNLGMWNAGITAENEHFPAAISIAPPAGTPCFPVGVGIITWQGRLSISVRLHSGLVPTHSRLPEELLDEVNHQLREFGLEHSEFFATSLSRGAK